MPTHLHMIYDCFCTVTAEMSTCNWDHTANKLKYYLDFYKTKKFAYPWYEPYCLSIYLFNLFLE